MPEKDEQEQHGGFSRTNTHTAEIHNVGAGKPEQEEPPSKPPIQPQPQADKEQSNEQ